MGLWTAVGLAIAWVVAFTLFPALQKALRTPTGRTVPIRVRALRPGGRGAPGLHLPLALAAPGGVAGALGRRRWWRSSACPGRVAPMRLGVDSLDYVDPDLAIHRDMVFFREHVSGLNAVRVWVQTRARRGGRSGGAARARPLHHRGGGAARRCPSVVGPTTFLRMRRDLAGQGEQLPQDPAAFAAAGRRRRAAAAHRAGAARLHRRGDALQRAAHGALRPGATEADYQALARDLRRRLGRDGGRRPGLPRREHAGGGRVASSRPRWARASCPR